MGRDLNEHETLLPYMILLTYTHTKRHKDTQAGCIGPGPTHLTGQMMDAHKNSFTHLPYIIFI